MFTRSLPASTLGAAAMAITVTLAAQQAQATVIDFNDVPTNTILLQSGAMSTPLVTKGFRITATGITSFVGNTDSGNPDLPDNGTNYLLGSVVQYSIVAVDGSAFSLTSFDAAEFHEGFPNDWSPQIRVNGIFANTFGIIQNFDLDFLHDGTGGDPDFQTFAVTGFDNIVELRFQGMNALRFNQFSLDNIALTTAAVTSVPEPATLALFGLGIAGLGAARRARKH